MANRQGGGNAKWVPGFLVLLASFFVSCTLDSVDAAEQHQVGGPPGWSLPSMANVNYTLWASSQTFKMGDTLYFNYSSEYHNVLEVTAAKYESCDASDPTAQWAKGADVISLNSSGTFYYICGIPGHCQSGQKVAVQVVGAVVGTRHQVGGAPGWSLPSRSNVNYTVWASTETFLVGDTLYFNYSKEFHNVLQVTASKYDKCDASSPIEQWDDGATTIPLNMTGTFYYICGITGHCAAGQKVSVTVAASSSSILSPASAPTALSHSNSSSASLYTHSISPLSGLLALSLVIIVALPY